MDLDGVPPPSMIPHRIIDVIPRDTRTHPPRIIHSGRSRAHGVSRSPRDWSRSGRGTHHQRTSSLRPVTTAHSPTSIISWNHGLAYFDILLMAPSARPEPR